MTGVPQLSVAATLFGLRSQSGILVGLHLRFRFAGHLVNVGGSVSTFQSMNWLHEAELPHPSVATQVSVRVYAHPLTVSTWLRVMVGKEVQPSAALTA